MTKIKNFRIHLRSREIARWLKHHHQMATTPDLEAAIEGAIARLKGKIQSAAIYTTITRATAEKATPIVFPEKSVAVSLVAASIGPQLDQYIHGLTMEADALELPLAQGIQQEALQQAVQFAVRLLLDQAKEEDCDVSAPLLADDPAIQQPLAGLLGCRRIGLDIGEHVSLPVHARLSWIFWTPQGKHAGRRSAEKVAA